MERNLTAESAPEILDTTPNNIEKAFATSIFDEKLRAEQRALWDVYKSNPSPDVNDYHSKSADMTAEYIQNAGITADDEKYTSYLTTAREYSWDIMTDEEWRLGTLEEGNDYPVPGRARLQVEQSALFGYQVSRDGTKRVFPRNSETRADDTADTESTPVPEKTLEELQKEIQEATEESSIAYAKRMKVGYFSRKSKKNELQEAYDSKREALNELVSERDLKLIEQLRSENIPEEEIAKKIAEESNNFVEKQDEVQHDAMLNKFEKSKRPVAQLRKLGSKALNAYANSNTATKLAVGASAGLVLAAGAGVALGAGTILTATGATGVVAARVYRSYALNRSKIYKTPSDYEQINATTGKTPEEIMQEAVAKREQLATKRIEEGDKVKKKAVIFALGAVAFTGVAAIAEHSGAIKEVAGVAKEKMGDIKDGIGGWLEGNDSADNAPKHVDPIEPNEGNTPGNPDAQPETPAPAEPDTTPDPTPDTLPEAGVADSPEQFTDANHIDVGEGWYQTFGELGVANANDQAALLNNEALMGKLAEMNMAYSDNSIGGWGIRMTADGKMPAEAADLIRETAKRQNIALNR